MFEKEAEEWANKIYPSDGQAQRYLLMGAMFGYNKANEWHYVKDGDLPKEGKDYLIYTKEFGVEIRNYHTDTKGFCCIPNDMVIAWKEIVLPEESE